jgi:hypothetical protein
MQHVAVETESEFHGNDPISRILLRLSCFSLEFRLEASNTFNHPTFGQPAARQGQFGLF